jgi:uncharacterized protein YlaI
MDVKCSLCGKTDEITKIHKDYIKIARMNTTYICEMCQNKVRFGAMEKNKPKKPM